MVDTHEFAWGVLATDVDFGPDGGLYILDWIEGWDKTGKGRIHRISDPTYLQSEAARNIKQLLASDWSKKSISELAQLLNHVDRRVRMEAQVTLVQSSSRQEAMNACMTQIDKAATEKGKLFAIWTLGQILKHEKSEKPLATLHKLLQDQNPKIVATVLRMLSDKKPMISLQTDEFVALLNHADDHVKAQAALCLSKQRVAAVFPAILKLLEAHGNDPWLRHAATMALDSLIEQQPELWKNLTATTAATSVRLAGVIAARRLLAEDQLLTLLNDPEPTVRQEAIRAIHDEPGLAEAKQALSTTPFTSDLSVPLQLRLLNAQPSLPAMQQQHNGSGDYASQAAKPEQLRLEALKMLANWATPFGKRLGDQDFGGPLLNAVLDPAKLVFAATSFLPCGRPQCQGAD